MSKKKLGCMGWMMVILFFPFILGLAMLALGFAIIAGIIYGMIYGYKNGKFDNITAKINEMIAKLYNKAFKKELSKPILSPKGFTIITTILIFLVISAFGSTEEGTSTNISDNQTLKLEQSTENKSDEKEEVIVDKNDEEEKVEEVSNVIETTDAEIHFINTGNSDAILIKQGSLSALIDGGENGDESAVVSYLKEQGVNELEYVFATHPDADHIGGLDAVINSISVKNVFVSNGDADTKTYSDFINAIANKGLTPSVPLLNSEFELGSSKFKVLSVANTNDPNNNSLVLLYTNGNDKVLFTGDAGQEIENSLDVGDIDLLKVGHHGSKTSTSSSFIAKTKPEYAVLLVGENNRYNHPDSEVMNILKNNNIEIHRTDECGHIVFKSSGNGLTVDCKEGSYNAGENEESNTSNNSSVDEENVAVVPTPAPQPVTEPEPSTGGGIVYWTPSGKSYHTTDGCSTLSRSKTILSGTQAESGKSDPCDRCH